MNLVCPPPLPDELAAGYLGRVFRINGFDHSKRSLGAVLEWAGIRDESRRVAPLVQALAKVAGMDLKPFVAQHTMLPLRRAIVSDRFGNDLYGANQGTKLWALAMRPTRPGLYVCRRCVLEDIDFHGVSYWRREHQIPGMFFCGKHGEALQCVEAADATKSLPSDVMGEGVEPIPSWLKEARSSAVVQRYLDLCSCMLQRADPLQEWHVSKAAGRRASQLNLHTGKGVVRRHLLSDLICEKVNRQWIEAVIPATAGFLPNQICPPLDGVVRGKAVGYSASAYLLAFAALYEDSDEALKAITAGLGNDLRNPKKPRARRSVPADALVSSYVRNLGSHTGVACEIDLDPSDATGQLKALGLPRLGGMRPDNLEAVVDSILIEGKTIAEACHDVGTSAEAIRRALTVALAPLRSALKKMPAASGSHKKNENSAKKRGTAKRPLIALST